MKHTPKLLLEHKISPSITRVAIYNYFKKTDHHPSVDEIYKTLKLELPTLSKTTVYNVLNLFLEENLVKHVNIKGTDQLFELTKEKHSHFKCTSCGDIYDIPNIQTVYDTNSLNDFVINDEEVTLTGLCKACQNKN